MGNESIHGSTHASDGRKGLACITGASSGIGRAFSQQLAAEGYDLLLTGRRVDKLEQLAQELTEAHGCKVALSVGELRDRAYLRTLAAQLGSEPELRILVNNAGYGVPESFGDSEWDTQADLHHVLVTAPLELSHAALPAMRNAGTGAIINVSSLASLVPAPGAAVYCASKAFINRFSETLALEEAGNGIHAMTVLPGYVRTDFFRDDPDDAGRAKGFGWLSPEDVAGAALKGLRRGRIQVVPGLRYRLVRALSALLPRPILYAILRRRGHKL